MVVDSNDRRNYFDNLLALSLDRVWNNGSLRQLFEWSFWSIHDHWSKLVHRELERKAENYLVFLGP